MSRRASSRIVAPVDYAHPHAGGGTGTPAWLKAEKRQLCPSSGEDAKERPAKKGKPSRTSAAPDSTALIPAGSRRSTSSKRSIPAPFGTENQAPADAPENSARDKHAGRARSSQAGRQSCSATAAAAAGQDEKTPSPQKQQQPKRRRRRIQSAGASATTNASASQDATGSGKAAADAAAPGLPGKPGPGAATCAAAAAAAASAEQPPAAAKERRLAAVEVTAAPAAMDVGSGAASGGKAAGLASTEPLQLVLEDAAAAAVAAIDTTSIKSQFAELQAEYRRLRALYDELKAQKIGEMEGLLAVQDGHVTKLGQESHQLVEHWRKEAEQQRLFAASVRSAETVRHIKQLQDSKLDADEMLFKKEDSLLELKAQVAELQEKLAQQERPEMVAAAVQATPDAVDSFAGFLPEASVPAAAAAAPGEQALADNPPGTLQQGQQLSGSRPHSGSGATSREAATSPVAGLMSVRAPGTAAEVSSSSGAGVLPGQRLGDVFRSPLQQQQQQQGCGSSSDNRQMLTPDMPAAGVATTPALHCTPVGNHQGTPSVGTGSLARCRVRTQQLDQLRQALRKGLPGLLVPAVPADGLPAAATHSPSGLMHTFLDVLDRCGVAGQPSSAAGPRSQRCTPPASAAAVRASPASASRVLPLLPLTYLCDFEPEITGAGSIQYRHIATGFTFQMGPAGKPAGRHSDEEEEVSFVPIHCGGAEAALPDFLKAPFTFAATQKPRLMTLLFKALADAASTSGASV